MQLLSESCLFCFPTVYCVSFSFLQFWHGMHHLLYLLNEVESVSNHCTSNLPSSDHPHHQILATHLKCEYSTLTPAYHTWRWNLKSSLLTLNAKWVLLWKTTLDQGCDIIFAQETHFTSRAVPRCTHKVFPHIFMGNCLEKKKKRYAHCHWWYSYLSTYWTVV